MARSRLFRRTLVKETTEISTDNGRMSSTISSLGSVMERERAWTAKQELGT